MRHLIVFTDGYVLCLLQVGTNGLLSFESAYNEFSNQVFPGSSEISSRYLVAPFWDDIDISRDETGQISYEIHQSGYYLDRVNDFLQRKRPSAFSGSWMFVAYWDSVRPYPGSSFTEVRKVYTILVSFYSCICFIILRRSIPSKPYSSQTGLIPMQYSPMIVTGQNGAAVVSP